jgi:hypothetical protein
MGTTLRIGTTKEQLTEAGFVPNNFYYDAHSYEVVHPAGDVRLIVTFRRTDADVFTKPTAPANTPEHAEQEKSPRHLPTVEFKLEDGTTDRIIELVLAYRDVFLGRK